MEKFVALTASGVAYGAVLAIAALGFLVLYKATGVINFAHGDLITLGGYIALWGVTDLHLPSVPAFALALVLMFAVGLLLERVAYAPLRRRPPIVVVIATLAAATLIRGGVAIWQGSTPKTLPTPVGDRVVRIFGAPVAQQRVVIVAIGGLSVLGVLLLFQRTAFGRQVRAMAHDPEAARLQGVRTHRVAMVVFGLSASLAALAAVLVAPLSALDLNFGFTLMVTAIAAAVLGGFGSLGGVVIGAMIIGLVQQLIGGYVFTNYASTLPFILLFVVIAIRPSGIVSLNRARL